MMTQFPRRLVLRSLAILPLSAQFATLAGPLFAQADLETINLTTPSGRDVAGYLAVPAGVPAPAVLLIHGSVGASNTMKNFARDFARDGFLALVLDLFDGRTGQDENTRETLKREVRLHPDKAMETIAAWLAWLKAEPRCTGKTGVIGWSFGAPWALEASMATPVEATVAYVGVAYPAVSRLAQLKGPMLVHLAEDDTDVGRNDIKLLENSMRQAGKSLQVFWYPGDHYFPFPPYPTYNKEQADLAWSRTIEFYRANLQ